MKLKYIFIALLISLQSCGGGSSPGEGSSSGGSEGGGSSSNNSETFSLIGTFRSTSTFSSCSLTQTLTYQNVTTNNLIVGQKSIGTGKIVEDSCEIWTFHYPSDGRYILFNIDTSLNRNSIADDFDILQFDDNQFVIREKIASSPKLGIKTITVDRINNDTLEYTDLVKNDLFDDAPYLQENAIPIVLDVIHDYSFSEFLDIDYFKINISSTGFYRFTIETSGYGFFEILDSNNNLICDNRGYCNYSMQHEKNLTFNLREEGSYYIKLYDNYYKSDYDSKNNTSSNFRPRNTLYPVKYSFKMSRVESTSSNNNETLSLPDTRGKSKFNDCVLTNTFTPQSLHWRKKCK